MSNYHVTTQSPEGKRVEVIWHIPIPSGHNNSAGVDARVALVGYLTWTTKTDPIESNCPGITSGELAQVQAGELYELRRGYSFSSIDPGLSNAEKAAELDAEYARLSTAARTKLDVYLEWWGLARDV